MGNTPVVTDWIPCPNSSERECQVTFKLKWTSNVPLRYKINTPAEIAYEDMVEEMGWVFQVMAWADKYATGKLRDELEVIGTFAIK